MSALKIIGLIQANNEWPLLSLSISHALYYHVDEVCLLNHYDDHPLQAEMNHLKKIWGNRIHIINFSDPAYLQEACTNTMIQLMQTLSPDWIYVFDADEFLIPKQTTSLRTILSSLNPQCSIVRYEVQNWVSTEDFDDYCLDHYQKLIYRSEPSPFFNHIYTQILADELYHGNINFFDIPFPSKVIVKNHPDLWLAAGAHKIKNPIENLTAEFKCQDLKAAHFPYLSKKRLSLKVKQGERLIQANLQPYHGWQNQLLYRLFKENKLDLFWQSHSISSSSSLERTPPSVVIDDTFAKIINPIISLLKKAGSLKCEKITDEQSIKYQDTQVSLNNMINAVRKFQLIAECNYQKYLNTLELLHSSQEQTNTLMKKINNMEQQTQNVLQEMAQKTQNALKEMEQKFQNAMKKTILAKMIQFFKKIIKSLQTTS